MRSLHAKIKYLGLYEDNDLEKPGYEYRKSMFGTDIDTV